MLTRSTHGGRVVITPVCASYLAYAHGFQSIDSYMRRNAAGRPYYYSHYTDYYRYVTTWLLQHSRNGNGERNYICVQALF
jgi:hypothetical protein